MAAKLNFMLLKNQMDTGYFLFFLDNFVSLKDFSNSRAEKIEIKENQNINKFSFENLGFNLFDKEIKKKANKKALKEYMSKDLVEIKLDPIYLKNIFFASELYGVPGRFSLMISANAYVQSNVCNKSGSCPDSQSYMEYIGQGCYSLQQTCKGCSFRENVYNVNKNSVIPLDKVLSEKVLNNYEIHLFGPKEYISFFQKIK